MGRQVALQHPKQRAPKLDESMLEEGEYLDLGGGQFASWSGFVQAVTDEEGVTVGTLIYVDHVDPDEIFPDLNIEEEND